MAKGVIIREMGRQKENREPREPIQMPKSWMTIARKLAAEARMPVVWYLISLLSEKAEDNKEYKDELPPLPWEPSDD